METRFDDDRLPKAEAERVALAEQIGADGRTLLTAVWSPEAPAWLREVPAVRILHCVWSQQYYAVEDVEPMRWRVSADLPPAARMINTPYDVDARYSVKRTTTWTGCKVHLTETCDEDTPNLITHVLTTEATTPDWHAPEVIHTALADKALLPAEHLLDAGYVDSEVMVTSQTDHEVKVIGPVSADNSWQAREGAGFDVACFTLDWEAQRATCPQGASSRKWSATHDTRGNPLINIRFDAAACATCSVRQQCTRSEQGPREMTVRPRAQYEALQAACQFQQTPEFKAQYENRARAEGMLAQGLRIAGLRCARYVGLAKTSLQHVLTAAAINLRRIGDWLADIPRTKTRTALFAVGAGGCWLTHRTNLPAVSNFDVHLVVRNQPESLSAHHPALGSAQQCNGNTKGDDPTGHLPFPSKLSENRWFPPKMAAAETRFLRENGFLRQTASTLLYRAVTRAAYHAAGWPT